MSPSKIYNWAEVVFSVDQYTVHQKAQVQLMCPSGLRWQIRLLVSSDVGSVMNVISGSSQSAGAAEGSRSVPAPPAVDYPAEI